LEQPPWRHAGRIHHDDFGIGRKFVERMADGHHQCDRRDNQDQVRNDEAGDTDKDQYGLTAVGHQVDVAQGLGDPDDGRQADQHQQERAKRGAENVNANRTHPPAPSPVAQPCGAPDPRPERHVLEGGPTPR
jgi:hypothetical protein